MNNDPVLAAKEYIENDGRYRIRVFGGLNYLRGNSAPYFSITGEIKGPRGYDCGGCIHDEIAKHFPDRFTDLIALHLSDINGVPMHFLGNGWYNLAGALGGAGQRYHVGNSERHFPKVEIDPAKPWATTDYRAPTEEECLQIFADHCRIPLAEARVIRDDVRAEFGPESESHYEAPHNAADYARGKARWEALGALMLPRFKREADACIARLSLQVYGDEWAAA